MGEVYEAVHTGDRRARGRQAPAPRAARRCRRRSRASSARCARAGRSPRRTSCACSTPRRPMPRCRTSRWSGCTARRSPSSSGATPRLSSGPELLALCRQIGAGIDAAAAAGIVHRDLKPQNLFRCEDGTWKILDFGVATLADEHRHAHARRGRRHAALHGARAGAGPARRRPRRSLRARRDRVPLPHRPPPVPRARHAVAALRRRAPHAGAPRRARRPRPPTSIGGSRSRSRSRPTIGSRPARRSPARSPRRSPAPSPPRPRRRADALLRTHPWEAAMSAADHACRARRCAARRGGEAHARAPPHRLADRDRRRRRARDRARRSAARARAARRARHRRRSTASWLHDRSSRDPSALLGGADEPARAGRGRLRPARHPLRRRVLGGAADGRARAVLLLPHRARRASAIAIYVHRGRRARDRGGARDRRRRSTIRGSIRSAARSRCRRRSPARSSCRSATRCASGSRASRGARRCARSSSSRRRRGSPRSATSSSPSCATISIARSRSAAPVGSPATCVGAWQLGNVLGRGAMGEVYEATHATSGAPAAVKLLRRELLADPQHVERFLREVRVASAIESPHVVRVLEASAPADAAAVPRDGAPARPARSASCSARAARSAPRELLAVVDAGRRACSSSRARPASCTAISSRRTCSAPTTAPGRCSTSASRSSPTARARSRAAG